MGVMVPMTPGVNMMVSSVLIVPGMVVGIHAKCPYFNYAGEDP
jgi:hypothetical protein